jgi:hypothetical protein
VSDEQIVWAVALVLGVALVLFNRQWARSALPAHPVLDWVGRLIIAGMGLLFIGASVLVLAGYAPSGPVVWPWE